MSEIKKIGLFTSGGDAPGMNAAIRAVTRSALYNGLEVRGIMRGYEGMIEGEMINMTARSVANIMNLGGTILKTARSDEFRTVEGRKRAYDQLQKHEIDALVAVGGNGTFTGLQVFQSEHGIPTIGLPGTIDNDLAGTDFTIGFDTACNTAMRAIDNIRDTAMSHERIFVVEVMGRDSGFLALSSGMATGAEDVFIPESPTDMQRMVDEIDRDKKRKKNVRIVIAAEGDEFNALTILEKVKELRPDIQARMTILGHIQRGGSPTANDRNLSSILGFYSVKKLLEGVSGCMVGLVNQKVVCSPYSEVILPTKEPDTEMLEIIKVLST